MVNDCLNHSFSRSARAAGITHEIVPAISPTFADTERFNDMPGAYSSGNAVLSAVTWMTVLKRRLPGATP